MLKILLIEDNPADAFVLEKHLTKIKREKFELQIFTELTPALNHLQQQDFDAILTDLHLPDSQGLTTVKRIYQTNRGIPIIVLTGLDDEENAIAALREGAEDYLIKGEIQPLLLSRSIHYAVERKRISGQLLQSEARYRTVVQEQTELICRFLADGTFTFVNEAYCHYVNKQAEEVVGTKFQELLTKPEVVKINSVLTNLNISRPLTTFEHQSIYPNREFRWQQWNIRAIFDQQEVLVEYQAVGRDITERKQIETEKMRLMASLHESEGRFRLMANTAPVMIWLASTDGLCTFFNQSWLDFSGRSLDKELGYGWWENVHRKDRDRCLEIYQREIATKSPFEIEYRFRRHDGKYRWVLNKGIPNFNHHGHCIGYIGSCIDITERKQAEEVLRKQARKEHLMAEITQYIHESLDLEEILYTAVQQFNNFLKVDRLVIFKLPGKENNRLLFESITTNIVNSNNFIDDSSTELSYLADTINNSHVEEIIKINDLQVLKIVSNDFFLTQKKIGVRALLLLPIKLEREIWGWICAQQYSKPRYWQNLEIDLMQQLGVQLAIAIQQSELYHQLEETKEELESIATIDAVTGISNRRKFERYIDNEWRRLSREQAPLSLILCDIDYFKFYNDTYGHQAGDECLYKVAKTIDKVVKRPADLAARYGGEEFAVILPNTPLTGAVQLAEQMRLAVKNLNIPHQKSAIANCVTLSLGVAYCIPARDSHPRDLIKTADMALYQAKESGRDRVVEFFTN